MNRTLKNYFLIFDSFGDMEMWSLQHPTNGAKDSYLITPNTNKEIKNTKWYKELQKLKDALDTLSLYYLMINCKISFIYDKKSKTRYVTEIKNVINIELIPDESNPLN